MLGTPAINILGEVAFMPDTRLVSILATTASAFPLAPMAILGLCVLAGLGTVLMLPGRRDASFRKLGAVVLLAAVLIFASLLVRRIGGASGTGVGPYFWIFSAIALFGAIRVVTHTQPVYSALYFVLTVFASAGLFLLLDAEFMAAALILIYAGAILVTYVFVIMLAAEAMPSGTGANGNKVALMGLADHDAVSREPFAAAVIGFALMGVMLFLIFDRAQMIEPVHATASTVVTGNTQALGAYLFKSQIVNLELAGLLLTIAMVGAIVIARKRVSVPQTDPSQISGETLVAPATPVDDNPHSIPVYGTTDRRQKAYPQT
jgi:NADH-quinone oxidoreductase subunit J